jgi:hypothetical protein
MALPELKRLTREDGETIAYLQRAGKTPDRMIKTIKELVA